MASSFELLVGSAIDTGGSPTHQLVPCHLVNNFTADWDQCNFVIQNECLEEDALDYVYFVYCIMGSRLRYISIITVITLILIFFLTLSTIADEFLCPSLLTIAKSLRMSDNLAGITLLAFGNGSSDIFSSLAAASSGKAELIISELLGAGIFCLSIVAGLIFIKQDFRLAYRPLLRDTVFYLFAVYFTWFVCWGQQITFYYALAFILIYVIYLTVALGGQAIFSHLQQKKRHRKMIEEQKLPIVMVEMDKNKLNVPDQNEKSPSPLIESDWSPQSDWFVQSHDSVKRRRLSRSKLLTSEDRALLHNKDTNKTKAGGDLKYGLNENVTHIRIECNKQPEIVKRKNSAKDVNSDFSYTNPKIDCITIGEDLNKIINSKSSSKINNLDGDILFEKPKDMQRKYSNFGSSIDIKLMISDENSDVETQIQNSKLKEKEDTLYNNNNEKSFSFSDSSTISNLDDSNSISLNEWDDLLAHVNPIYVSEWSESSLMRKTITIIRAPLLFVAICTVPVVDHDKKRSNWCRLLNIFHCISIPMVIFISHKLSEPANENLNNNITKSTDSPNSISSNINSMDLILTSIMQYYPFALFGIGLFIAIYMFKTTQSEKPPKYHVIFAYAGFIMSILWIYTLVTEILGLLKTIGIVFSMSDTTIGLAFLAWGNSLGDIVANLALAEAGYPRMAIGACIGAPLLNLLIGFGLSFVINLSPGEVVTIEYTPTITLLCLSLGIVIASLMLCALIPPDYSKRPFGYILMSAYAVYFVLAVLLEFELISFD